MIGHSPMLLPTERGGEQIIKKPRRFLASVLPTVLEIAVKNIPILQEVTLSVDGELDVAAETVLKPTALVKESVTPSAPRRDNGEQGAEPLVGEPFW